MSKMQGVIIPAAGTDTTSYRRNIWLLLLLGSFLSAVCFTTWATAQVRAPSSTAVSADKASPQAPEARFPLNFQRHTGDLDAMLKAQNI